MRSISFDFLTVNASCLSKNPLKCNLQTSASEYNYRIGLCWLNCTPAREQNDSSQIFGLLSHQLLWKGDSLTIYRDIFSVILTPWLAE